MTETKKKEAKAEPKGEVTREEFDNLAAKVRGMVANWKRYSNKSIHKKPGVKAGYVSAIVACLFCGSAMAADIQVFSDNDSSRTEVWSLSGDGDGTATLVLTGSASISEAITMGAIPVTALNLGSVTSSVASVVESGDGINHKTVITMTAVQLVVTDGGFIDSEILYSFPQGHIKWEGAVLDATCTMTTTNFNSSTADLYNMSVGSAESAAGDGTLTGTSITMIPSISIDTVNGTNLVNDCDGASTSATFIDGSTTPVPIVINMGVPAANDLGANTNNVTGTLTLFWKFLGDN